MPPAKQADASPDQRPNRGDGLPLFSSARERRLWLWTLAVVVAIYSTLGLTGAWAGFLRRHGVLEISFLLGALLVGATILAQGLKARRGGSDIAVVLGIIAAYLMVFVRMSIPEERTHLIEYGIVAAFIYEALSERVSQGRHVPYPALLTVILTSVIGAVDECIQAVLPSRVFDPIDILFNFIAAAMAVVARLAMAPPIRPGWRLWFLWLIATAFGWGQGVYWGWYTPEEPKTLAAIPAVIFAGYMGLVAGVSTIGVLQWLALRRHLKGAWRWLLATLGATAIVGAVIFGVGLADKATGWLAGVSMFGPVAGVLQWTILRGQVVGAGWWIVASTAAWIIAMPLGDMAGPPGLGAAYGANTGTVLVWLLRQEPAAGIQPQSA